MTLAVEPASASTIDGDVVPLDMRRNGPSFDPFAPLVLPSGRMIRVEIDTGSSNPILATRYLSDCGLSLDNPSIETTTGTDETGYQWTRHHATITGSVHLADAPRTVQRAPRVMFQDIIHDGLVGTAYLERYRITFDVSGERLILAPRRTGQ